MRQPFIQRPLPFPSRNMDLWILKDLQSIHKTVIVFCKQGLVESQQIFCCKGQRQSRGNCYFFRPIMKMSRELQQYTPESIDDFNRVVSIENCTFEYNGTVPYHIFQQVWIFHLMVKHFCKKLSLWVYLDTKWRTNMGGEMDRKPCRMMLPIRRSNVQGETIFFDDDGRSVYLISRTTEPHPVYRMELSKIVPHSSNKSFLLVKESLFRVKLIIRCKKESETCLVLLQL